MKEKFQSMGRFIRKLDQVGQLTEAEKKSLAPVGQRFVSAPRRTTWA